MDVNRAIELAVVAHGDQKDKAGLPYIYHCLTVMSMMSTEEECIVAVLHDTIEDTKLTYAGLSIHGFSEPVLIALQCLTKETSESYENYILRVKKNDLARRVKLADLTHNMDVRRLSRLTDYDIKRLRKYHKAWKELTC